MFNLLTLTIFVLAVLFLNYLTCVSQTLTFMKI